jgi:uncharacterized membrane protein YphA (DoxX/SURF4 family)
MPENRDHWTPLTRIAFRFAFVYLALYCWPYPLAYAIPPATETIADWATAPLHALTPWVAVHVFHLSGAVTAYHPTGSGDTTLNYIEALCFAVATALAAVLWAALDRARPHYRALFAWLRLMVRLYLGGMLLLYGFSKILVLQMPEPSPARLLEPLGEMSPMGLLWNFIGASLPYEHFAGLSEIAGGALLLFRRTTTLGAGIAAAVLLNVVMLNFCYDVPVKLFSSHLLLMALFLLLPDTVPIVKLFVLRQAGQLGSFRVPRPEGRALRIAGAAVYVAIFGGILYSCTWDLYRSYGDYGAQAGAQAGIRGTWSVDAGSPGGALPWRTLRVDSFTSVTARTQENESVPFKTVFDETNRHIRMTGTRTKHSADFAFAQSDAAHLALTGTIDGVAVALQLHRVTREQFSLVNRGFHWISEDPFNR